MPPVVRFDDPVLEESEEEERQEGQKSGSSDTVMANAESSAASTTGSTAAPTSHPRRPGPTALTGRPQSQRSGLSEGQGSSSNENGSGGTGTSGSSETVAAKKLAAGEGTRTKPRPVPKSSSSLRHISSSRNAKTLSFAALPEDGPSSSVTNNDTGSAIQRRIDAEARKRRQMLQQEDFMATGSDDELEQVTAMLAHRRPPSYFGALESDDGDSDTIIPPSRRTTTKSKLSRKGSSGGAAKASRGLADSSTDEQHTSDDDAGWSDGAEADDTLLGSSSSHGQQAISPGAGRRPSDDDPFAQASRAARYAAQEPGGPSPAGPKRAAWHPKGPSSGSPTAMTRSHSGLQTPGINFPAVLNTPMEGSPGAASPDFEPRQRLEWQTMLESVLASEVLRSETKRITSVDAPDLTREQLMYRRWLDIRASLRGRGHMKGAVDAEEKRLRSGWPELLKTVIAEIKTCRAKEERQSLASSGEGGSPAELSVQDSQREVDALVQADESAVQPESFPEDKDAVFKEIESLLARVDASESQFPSARKAIEVVPEWNDAELQAKLDGLRAWHNITSLLRLQLKILREWTGSETLQIDVPLKRDTRQDDANLLIARANGDVEGMTFVERILKEDSLQATFENRTLHSLNNLILKAKATIKSYHETFVRLQLPSFAPELVQLISFPMRLMEGALQLRLDYAGKIKEPSLLIVDSLTDDLRSALSMAIRTKEQYSATMIPDPDAGWDLQPVIGASYDEILRDALRFFFRLISFKLKGSVFFKETEILDSEWHFLRQAVAVIDGGDVIVAKNITKIVNKLFARIVAYFERELSAPSTARGKAARSAGDGATGADSTTVAPGTEVTGRGPSMAGGLTKGTVHLSLADKIKWIHAVFDNVRIRSRKLLGFARDIRNRLDNAAEYDLATLRPSVEVSDQETATGDQPDAAARGSGGPASAASTTGPAAATPPSGMDLNAFLQTLINADYFLVYTETYEERGIYIIAEPGLHDKPEVISELLGKCMKTVSLKEAIPTQADPIFAPADELPTVSPEGEGEENAAAAPATSSSSDDQGPPRYLLLLTPRDAFLWTGRVMSHRMEPVDVSLGERRLRLIADGPKERLQLCKQHFYSVFTAAALAANEGKAAVNAEIAAVANSKGLPGRRKRAGLPAEPAPAPIEEEGATPSAFPLDVIHEHMAHMSDVQHELRSINKGVYMLSNAILAAVPSVRRNMRRRQNISRANTTSNAAGAEASGESDELVQNCFSMAAEQGFRSLPFIESARLRGYMTLSLARLAIDWVGFICDDCVPTDRKTFKWAVAALENAVQVTRNENIFHLSEEDFNLMRAKVASCMALLISHFDILGARSSVAKAKEEQDRLAREKAERNKAAENQLAIEAMGGDAAERHAAAHRLVEGTGGVGAPPMLNRADSGMQATEERWVQKMMEWDQARQEIEAEQRLIGRVLDDTRLEDQGLQFLASSSSRIQIRWQQGRFIGAGTFGTVYLAVNLDSGGLMAVKEIRFADISNTPSLYKHIKDEMDVMEMLTHPNIVEYYGIEVHREKVYIFEEYCQGGSLAQLLEHGRIEDEAVIQVYTLQMLDGLVYLHSKDVVHRDIKPDNILLDHLGVIKYVDFGAAKVLAKNSRTVQRSRRGGIAAGGNMAGMTGPDGKPVGAAAVQSLQGTPMYMSPEVIKGESRGRRGAMDVWSLGCVVLEFATGRRPWSQLDNEWAIMFHIGMAQQHPPLPEPGQLSELGIDFIRQCLIIDPYDRPSAAEMREHPWIQELVTQLNDAANQGEEEGMASVQTDVNSQDYTNSSGSQQSSPFQHSLDSATGVAAMAATPGTRSINERLATRPVGL